MVQTPTQRRANAKYAHTAERRMGKPESAYKDKAKSKEKRSPVGAIVVGVLIFVVVVPLLLEPLQLLPQVWEWLRNLLVSVGLVKG